MGCHRWMDVDWILSSCTGIMGTTVGSSKFTDQDYADDAVLFSDCPSKWPYILSSFDEATHTVISTRLSVPPQRYSGVLV